MSAIKAAEKSLYIVHVLSGQVSSVLEILYHRFTKVYTDADAGIIFGSGTFILCERVKTLCTYCENSEFFQ